MWVIIVFLLLGDGYSPFLHMGCEASLLVVGIVFCLVVAVHPVLYDRSEVSLFVVGIVVSVLKLLFSIKNIHIILIVTLCDQPSLLVILHFRPHLRSELPIQERGVDTKRVAYLVPLGIIFIFPHAAIREFIPFSPVLVI